MAATTLTTLDPCGVAETSECHTDSSPKPTAKRQAVDASERRRIHGINGSVSFAGDVGRQDRT
jgi:hypothetical protein